MSVPLKKDGVTRFDAGELKKPVKQSNGWIRAEGYLARTGVQIYKRADGSEWREYRPAEEVFHADAVGSFDLVPLTNNHPSSGLLDADNTKLYQVGSVIAPKQDGEFLRSQILVTDSATIKEMEKGKVQLSGGYICDLEMTPGEIDGQRYDAIQRNIRGNHVALVTVGRAGPAVRVRMDSLNAEVYGFDNEVSHMKIRIDGVEYELSETAAQAVQKAFSAKDEEISKLTKNSEQEKARADAAESELKQAKEELAAAPAKFTAALAVRSALESQARKVLGAEAKLDGISDADVRKQVAEKAHGLKLEGKSETYVEAMFDLAIAKADSDSKSKDDGRQPIPRNDGDDLQTVQAKYLEAQRNAWKTQK